MTRAGASSRQLATVHAAKRDLRLNDPQYRLVLRNVARVDSASKLGLRQFEDVMGVLESLGYQGHPSGPTYWRDRVERRQAGMASPAQLRMIEAMCVQQGLHADGFARRMSCRTATGLADLSSRDAYSAIEALKAIEERREKERQEGSVVPVPEEADAYAKRPGRLVISAGRA